MNGIVYFYVRGSVCFWFYFVCMQTGVTRCPPPPVPLWSLWDNNISLSKNGESLWLHCVYGLTRIYLCKGFGRTKGCYMTDSAKHVRMSLSDADLHLRRDQVRALQKLYLLVLFANQHYGMTVSMTLDSLVEGHLWKLQTRARSSALSLIQSAGQRR